MVAKFIIGLTLLLCCQITNADTPEASIRLSMDTPSIYLGDIVVLEIESTGLLDPLDVSQLHTNHGFLRETTGTRIAVIGGKVREIALRRMEFIPTTEGVVIFGPLSADSAQGQVLSNSASLKVLAPIDRQWQPSSEDLNIQLTWSTTTPVIGEQLILDIQLRHRYPISNEQIQLPSLDSFDTVAITEQRRTLITENEGSWRQIAWRYLLHAKQSGPINMNGVQWRGNMAKTRTQRGDFTLTSKPTTLQVAPAHNSHNNWWLPASDVKLSETWSDDVRMLSAGDEILRTLTLQASGVLSHQIPDIEPIPTRSFSSTLIHTERSMQVLEDHTEAQATFVFRMHAQSPVPVFLDTVRVPWWDVKEAAAKEVIIPARRIDIGLPERADLLAQLAASNNRWLYWRERLAWLTQWQGLFLLCGCTVLGVLLGLQRHALKHTFRCFLAQQKQRRVLHRYSLNSDWYRLYERLNNLIAPQRRCHSGSTDILVKIEPSDAASQLQQQLQMALFSSEEHLLNQQDITQLVAQLRFSSPQTTTCSQHLPTL